MSETYTSTWQQWVVDAGSTAGSTAAVISEESMKCLKYCIHWLQYAIQHINLQMKLIRDYLVKVASNPNDNDTTILDTIKNEMITTLKKVIDVITCYAGNALPYQAKATIRKSILTLPNRWATLNTDETVAIRLLTFGQESSDMLSSVYQVFEDTVQRAENWLKSINVISSSIKSLYPDQEPAEEDQEFYNLLLKPIQNLQISS